MWRLIRLIVLMPIPVAFDPANFDPDNQKGLDDGELEQTSLKGFCEAANRLKIPIVNELEFHHQQRDASWRWGKEHGNSVLSAEIERSGG